MILSGSSPYSSRVSVHCIWERCFNAVGFQFGQFMLFARAAAMHHGPAATFWNLKVIRFSSKNQNHETDLVSFIAAPKTTPSQRTTLRPSQRQNRVCSMIVAKVYPFSNDRNPVPFNSSWNSILSPLFITAHKPTPTPKPTPKPSKLCQWPKRVGSSRNWQKNSKSYENQSLPLCCIFAAPKPVRHQSQRINQSRNRVSFKDIWFNLLLARVSCILPCLAMFAAPSAKPTYKPGYSVVYDGGDKQYYGKGGCSSYYTGKGKGGKCKGGGHYASKDSEDSYKSWYSGR